MVKEYKTKKVNRNTAHYGKMMERRRIKTAFAHLVAEIQDMKKKPTNMQVIGWILDILHPKRR